MQFFSYPASFATSAANPSVGPTGIAVPGDATFIGAKNPSGNLVGLMTDSNGYLYVNIAGNLDNPIPVTDAANGSVTGGAAGSKSELIGVQFNTSLPSLTTGQQAAAQADSSARLIISPLTNASIVKAQLQDNSGAAITLGQKTMASSVPVAIASDQSNVSVSQSTASALNATVVQPTAANLNAQVSQPTAANLNATVVQPTAANLHATANLNDGSGNAITSTTGALDVNLKSSGITLNTSDAANGSVTGGTAATKSELSGLQFNTSLPSLTTGQQAAMQGDSNARLIIAPLTNSSVVKAQLQDNAGSAITLGQKVMASSVPVVIASDQTSVPTTPSASTGRTQANSPSRNVYSSVNVTTGAYVQLVASLSNAVNYIEIFDSSGQTMALATGGVGSEVNQLYIFPGGNGPVPFHIAAGTRVSIIAISATANTGEIDINFYQ